MGEPWSELVARPGRARTARHVLEPIFDTGEVKTIDMRTRLSGPVSEPLVADYDLFCQVHTENDTITWPNGADWAPDELHRLSTPA